VAPLQLLFTTIYTKLNVTKLLLVTINVSSYVAEELLRYIFKNSCRSVFRVADLGDFVNETEIMFMGRKKYFDVRKNVTK
jgi:hypothetical protein